MILRYSEFLWGFLLVIPLVAGALLVFRKNRKYLKALGGEKRDEFLFFASIRLFLETLLMVGFIIFTMLSLTAPNWTSRTREYNVEGRDICFVLDISRSMTAKDIYPSRMDAMIDLVSFLVDRVEDCRFSIVVFKGDAFTAVPLTSDKVVLESFLEFVNIGMMTSPGSDLEKGLGEALRSLESDTQRDKTIILISDGEKQTGKILSVARRCQEKGIPVVTVATGTEEGAYLYDNSGSFYLDSVGLPVRTRVVSKDLKEIASLTEGAYYTLENLSPGGDILQYLEQDFLFSLARGIGFYRPDQYRFFLFPAVLFLFLYFLVRRFRWPVKK